MILGRRLWSCGIRGCWGGCGGGGGEGLSFWEGWEGCCCGCGWGRSYLRRGVCLIKSEHYCAIRTFWRKSVRKFLALRQSCPIRNSNCSLESVPAHSISPSALVSPEGYSVRTPLCISLESGSSSRVFFGQAVGRSGGGWIRWGW
jgi:hypothetical protein